MADIIPLAQFRFRDEIIAGYNVWKRQFKDEFHVSTRIKDLASATLNILAEPDEPSILLINSLITGFLGLGNHIDINMLNVDTQTRIVDIQLFLSDHIRFEMMRRLGWLDFIPAESYSLFEMVRYFDEIKNQCKRKPPLLACDHPGYEVYQTLISREQQVFIRQLLPKALDAFRQGWSNSR